MNGVTPNLVLVAVVVVLVAAGVYLILERSLTRVLVGVLILSNGINLLILSAGGNAGLPPLFDPDVGEEGMADPLPQAMILTAIVITLGLSAFLATLAYRSWQLNRHDEVQDDLEDRRVAARAAADRAAYRDIDTASDVTLDEEAAEVHDETILEDTLLEDGRPDGPGAEGGGPRG